MLVFLAILGSFLNVWHYLENYCASFYFSCSSGGRNYLLDYNRNRDLLSKLGVEAYKFDRIDLWLNPFHTDPDRSFQPALALTAIGSGGLFGKGFNVSDVYVPVRESDMILQLLVKTLALLVAVSLFCCILF